MLAPPDQELTGILRILLLLGDYVYILWPFMKLGDLSDFGTSEEMATGLAKPRGGSAAENPAQLPTIPDHELLRCIGRGAAPATLVITTAYPPALVS